MKDLIRELQELQLEVDDFIEDMDIIQSKFASRIASVEEYYNQERVLQKARTILSKYEALKAELETELEGETNPFLSNQLEGLIANIDTMKTEVSSLSKTLRQFGNGLIPKTLEKYARQIRKIVKSYFDKPMVSHTKKNNQIRDDLGGTNGKKFFQTLLNIKGSEFGIIICEPLDGNYTQNMPTGGNVFYKGKNISMIESWVKSRFKGKGVLSAALDPLVDIGKNAVLELKTEMQGYGLLIGGNFSESEKVYHFMPGTVLKYTKFRSRGDFFLEVVRLKAGRKNEYQVGDSINVSIFFGTRERINGDVKGAIGHSWGNMYAMRKHINVKDPGFGDNNFDPGM